MKRKLIYKGFNRFWHWLQSILFILLGITGFEVHGSLRLFGFDTAVQIHNVSAISLIVLVIFAIFWHLTTGEWKQYVPNREKFSVQLKYYTSGIFKGEPHPYRKTELSKLNPIQRFTYLGFKLIIIPFMVTTGILYMFHEYWPIVGLDGYLGGIARVHTVGAFLLTTFFIVHLYMITTGRTVWSNLHAMLTGWEELQELEEGDEIILGAAAGD